MTKYLIFRRIMMLCFCLYLVAAGDLFSQTDRGMKPIKVRTRAGKEIQLYKDSYALVVGNGNYTNGWDPLSGALKDVKEVETVLKKHGFTVTLKTNLTKTEFDRALAEFVIESGADENNRLLFYYAGHGYTRKSASDEDLGYLVMVDAPAPEVDKVGFELGSIDMESLVTQAEKILARHALFVFDSCFSGTILNARDQFDRPESISDSVRYPVRQFITAGRAGEVVPDYSDFKQAFLDLLEGRADEPFRDGYITGEELGFYLKNEVPKYNPTQHPQYGKIRNPKLDKGDFVFVLLPKEEAWALPPAELVVTSTPSGADIYVDNVWIGKTPLIDYKVDTGMQHEKQVTVRLELSGYKFRAANLTLRSRQQTPWDVRLEKFASRTGTLTVTSTPGGAFIYIDGDFIGQTPLHNYGIDTGGAREKQVEIRLELSGYKSHVERVMLRGGQQTPRDVRLEKFISQTGTLTVTSTPSGASVYIDGALIGPTPLHDYEIDTGGAREKRVKVGLELAGYKSRVAPLTLKGDQQTSWDVRLEKILEIQKGTAPNGFAPEGMVLIPAGDFQMGNNDGNFDEKPVHTVYLDAFYMDAYEVTNAQYKDFVDANPHWGKDDIPSRYHDGNYLKHWGRNSYGSGNEPVVYVNWYAAMAYAQWAGKRLPTEAEWEKAARGGLVAKKYPWGDSINLSKANYGHDVGDTTPVGRYEPNKYGLFDMAGNVWEWCLDEYQGNYYKISPRRNPIAGEASITQIISNFRNDKDPRVMRGGGWDSSKRSTPRVADRGSFKPASTKNSSGFRCAKSVSP